MTCSRVGHCSQCGQTAGCVETEEPDGQGTWIKGSRVGAKSYKQQGVAKGFLTGDWFGRMCVLDRLLTGSPVRRPQPWSK